ncbi:CHD5-like protein-domain-containing protein [Pisolithus microcarpus]|nr:CHD5-like protein-domain-containing protein [Pisolithus microcarpus]
MSLILTIFALVLFAELISWIGHSVLLDLAWGVCCRILYSASITRQRKLKAELLTTKKELLQTSAQDQFAKWAKLRRSVDKRLAELEKLNSELALQKTAFSVKFNSLVWILTSTAVRSVSVGVWQLACRRVIKVGERTAKAFIMDPGANEEKSGSGGSPTTSDTGKAS